MKVTVNLLIRPHYADWTEAGRKSYVIRLLEGLWGRGLLRWPRILATIEIYAGSLGDARCGDPTMAQIKSKALEPQPYETRRQLGNSGGIFSSIRKQCLNLTFEFTIPNASGNLSLPVDQNKSSSPANSVTIEGLAFHTHDICRIVQTD